MKKILKFTAIILSLMLVFLLTGCDDVPTQIGVSELAQAYNAAVQNGYEGTYEEWLIFIKSGNNPTEQPGQTDKPLYKIYDIAGTCPEYYGTRQSAWENTLVHRVKAKSLAERYRDSVYTNFDPAEKTIYLTFDDGPDSGTGANAHTRNVMNSLLKYGVGGTFFFTANNMNNNATTRTLVQDVYNNGFPIGLHSVSHTSYLTFDKEQLINDINSTNDRLEQLTGARSTLVRPPYGDLGEEQIQILTAMGMKVSMWSLDTLDWAHNSAGVGNDVLLQRIKDNVRAGDVLLAHTINAKTPAIIERLIEYLLAEGYAIKSLPDVNYIPVTLSKNERMQAYGQWEGKMKATVGAILISEIGSGTVISIDGVNVSDSLTPGKCIATVSATFAKSAGGIEIGSVQFEISTPVSVDIQVRLNMIEDAIAPGNLIRGSVQFTVLGNASSAFVTQIRANTKTSGGIKNITVEKQLQGFATPIASAGGSAAYQVRGLIKATDGKYYELIYSVVGLVNDDRPVASIYGDLLNSNNSTNVRTITQLKFQEMTWIADFDVLATEYGAWK